MSSRSMYGNYGMARSVRREVHVRSPWKRKRSASTPPFCVVKNLRQPFGLPFLPNPQQLLGRSCFVVNRGFRRGRRCGFQQLALLHHHHERTGGIRGGLALEVETGSFFGDELERNLLFEGERDVCLLGLDVILTARDVELGRSSFNDGSVHLYRLTLDGVPHGILIFLFAVGENELPSRKVHLVRRRGYNHVVSLFRWSGCGLDRKSSGFSRVCLRLSQKIGPAIVSAVIFDVLIPRVFLNLLLILRCRGND